MAPGCRPNLQAGGLIDSRGPSWTQAQLARHLALNRVTVARIETGTNLPSIPLLFRLADLFHCSADDFRRAGPDSWAD